jgi:plasmid stability protein|tara:strand:+ start:19 stop:483 length:465 start_codon:yes stop_codon:yes gene_type:complete
VDPVTIIGGATVAFNALKKGFQVGKDLQDMSGQLTQWASAMSDLSYAEQKNKNPPWWKALNGQSVEAEALEIFTAKKKAEAMRKELKDWISFSMGPSAWDELVATEGKIRKQKRDQEYRKAEMQEAIVTWGLSGFILLLFIGILSFIVYMVKYG